MGAEVEVVLGGVGDVGVDGCAGRDIAGPARLVPLLRTKQPRQHKVCACARQARTNVSAVKS